MTYAILVAVLLVLSVVLTFDTSWMNLLQGLRNELVFAQRNKAYGAYDLRQDYNRRLGLSVAAALGFFLVVVGTPFVVSKIGPKEKEPEKVKIVDVNLDLFQEEQPEE